MGYQRTGDISLMQKSCLIRCIQIAINLIAMDQVNATRSGVTSGRSYR